MILIEDDFLSQKDFYDLQDYCRQEFTIKRAGTEKEWKEFLVLDTPLPIRDQLEVDGYRIILSFIRKAHKDFDTQPRIHSDGIIENSYVDMASVLYINEQEGVTRNGTMFYEHREYGEGLPFGVSPELYNKALRDSNNLGRFRESDRVYSKPNRLLSYPANRFHAKFPSKIEMGERVVLVTFYTLEDERA